MILSDDRLNHFAHVIIDGIWDDDLVDYTNDEEALRTAKRAIKDFIVKEGNLDEIVRKKILTLKKEVYEGSQEWDMIYKKYYEEEVRRLGV